MKLWSSVRQGASKLAQEADKAMRVRKEESAISALQAEISGFKAALGEIALGLFKAGSLYNPQVAEWASKIASAEATIKQHEETINDIKLEQPAEGAPAAQAAPAQEAPVAGAAAVAQAAPVPAAPVEPPTAAALQAARPKFCPSCGKPTPPTGAFCQECGAKLA